MVPILTLNRYELVIIKDGEELVMSTLKMLDTKWDVVFYVKGYE